MEIRSNYRTDRRIPILPSTPMTVLLWTVDLVMADQLANELHETAPNLRVDVSLGIGHSMRHLNSGLYDAVLIDSRIKKTDQNKLITHIHRERPGLPIEVIDFGGQPQTAGLGKCDANGAEFANRILASVHRALTRHKAENEPSPGTFVRTERAAAECVELSAPTSRECDGWRAASEKRGSLRWPVPIPCKIEWHRESYTGCIHDLSFEGAFVEMSDFLPVGSEIVISFTAGGKPIRVEATVVHRGWFLNEVRNFDGIGVRLQNLSGEMIYIFDGIFSGCSQQAQPKTSLER